MESDDTTLPAQNSVVMVGRLSSAPQERELPSKARVVGFRVVVRREKTAMTKGSKQVSDWVECAAWTARLRRTVLQWKAGDTVEIEGALRRRYSRGSSAGGGRVEIEVLAGRRLSASL